MLAIVNAAWWCYFPLRYLPATLSANDGNMIKTVTNSSLFSIEFSLSSDDVRIIKMPNTPKATDA